MGKYDKLRSHFCGLTETLGEVDGRRRFVDEFKETVGLLEERSGRMQPVYNDLGRRVLADGRRNPYDFSFKGLAEAIGGSELLEYYAQRSDRDVPLFEASVSPAMQANINTFTATIAGLLEARVLEGFDTAGLVGDQLVTVRPTNLNGEKLIGVAGIELAEADQSRQPGQPHARVLLGERWVQTPELREKALAIEVTQEAVLFDRTGQILDVAGKVGEHLAYQRELEILRTVCGVENTYNYKGVAYNTYQSSAPWINTHANPASTYVDIDDCLELFRNMTDPETGYRVLIQPTTLLYDDSTAATWHKILNSTELRITDSSLQTLVPPQPFARSGSYNLVSSVIMRDVLVASGVSAANAKQYWFMGDPKKAFAWMENWPLRVQQAAVSESGMIDRGLVATYYANYRGRAAIVEPRYMIRNTN